MTGLTTKGTLAHKGLMDALLAAQTEMPTLPKDGTNPHFKSKYTPLDTIVETVGPVLSRHGLVWVTLPGHNGTGEPVLTYRLIHASSGETLEGTMPLLLAKMDPQGLGSALTYARRYSLSAVLNLVADEDDDGNSASRPKPVPQRPAPPQPEPLPDHTVEALKAAHDEAGVTNEWLRMQLVAIGAHDVPQRVSEATIRRLTVAQAAELLRALNAEIDVREGDDVGF